ncbi:zinc-binding dehydrogenase [Mycobacterium sp. shizuoka-1]|uniref:zinc-binding dehydrogenase n=1 Tax=Mycobacterium sp. shizuoka-1 TaxID=2039281 RepID=UPI000C065059|nr:zinc-binding dehydrogenase [Mycobacterium sp. shizuoka-1]GAY17653.1 zinc-dependent alcohol dehydrogenase [Mycobacterium sp. shizuoka-1]
MKAYHFNSASEGLRFVELDDLAAGPGQVVIDVKAAGLCHSDLHILKGHGGAWASKRPIILGHEIAGTVRQVGSGVSNVALGDRVAIALVSHPLSEMDPRTAPGLGCDGGYAEQAVFPADFLVKIPPRVSLEQAAVATDSISTAYHAVVTEAAIVSGMRVAIIGLGGLGLSGARIAVLRGATVYGVDIDINSFDAARPQGVTECFTSIADVPRPIDVVVDFAGVGTTTAEAALAVRLGGRVVVVGLGAELATINTVDLVTRNVRLQGSLGSSRDELAQVLGLIANGSLVPVLEEVPFDALTEALDRLDTGIVNGRLFTRPSH